MVLPRNITQIGEINSNCKVYVEDYVVSYIKQVNQLAMDKPMAVAIYGNKKEEDGVDYHFVYGGARLDYLSRECRHLSQAQLQEIDRNRKKYFQEYAFLGYCLLSGEMLEGFYIYEQGICRYMPGYARFYEKNDSMLAFMLDNRLTEVEPEVVDESKFAMIRSRQEERKHKNIEEDKPAAYPKEEAQLPDAEPLGFQYRFAKTAMGAVFCLVCVLAFALVFQGDEEKSVFNPNTWKELGGLFSDTVEDAEGQSGEALQAVANQVDKLVIEDKLNQAILAENENAEVSSSETTPNPQDVLPIEESQESLESLEGLEGSEGSEGLKSQEAQASTLTGDATAIITESSEVLAASLGAVTSETAVVSGAEISTESVVSTTAETTETTETTASSEAQETTETIQLVSYTIQPGDTLIGISTRVYGSESKVYEICKLNNISNPDDIKVGAKILLP